MDTDGGPTWPPIEHGNDDAESPGSEGPGWEIVEEDRFDSEVGFLALDDPCHDQAAEHE